jgi:hypothetical protein
MARNNKAPSIVAQMQEAPAPMQKASALPLSDTVEGQAPRKGRAIKPQASAASEGAKTSLKLSAIESEIVAAAREGFRGEAAGMTRDIAAIRAAAADGKACKTMQALYQSAVVAEILGFEACNIGLIRAQALFERGTKRTEEQDKAMNAARKRWSRRLVEAGIGAADNRGKPRGAKGHKGNAQEGKAPEAPKAPTQTVMIAPKGMTPPTLVTEADWVDHLHGLAAYLRTAQKKNAKAATHRVREVIAAFLKADAALKD